MIELTSLLKRASHPKPEMWHVDPLEIIAVGIAQDQAAYVTRVMLRSGQSLSVLESPALVLQMMKEATIQADHSGAPIPPASSSA